MKVWVVTNGCAYIVGVFDTEAAAKAARTQAEFDGVVGAYVEAVELNAIRAVPECVKTNAGCHAADVGCAG